ncbi:MAG: SDR family NAD(P)-dependent oxidoreductase [Sciscionella sp.]
MLRTSSWQTSKLAHDVHDAPRNGRGNHARRGCRCVRHQLLGATRTIETVLLSMRYQRSGRIINIGSLASWVGEPGEAFYAASKAALARYTEALRHEVWHRGIRVSLVEPGAFTTEVVASATNSRASIADYDDVRTAAQRTFDATLSLWRRPRGALASAHHSAATQPRPRHSPALRLRTTERSQLTDVWVPTGREAFDLLPIATPA